MDLVADTSVWSLVQRRPRVDVTNPFVQAFSAHIAAGDGIFLIENILQELLDGMRSSKNFDRLLTLLEPFPLLELQRETYVAAARLRTLCRSKEIQAGPIGLLIAATCCEYRFPLLTSDRNFLNITKHSDLVTLLP